MTFLPFLARPRRVEARFGVPDLRDCGKKNTANGA